MSEKNAPSELPLERAPLGMRAGRALVDALIDQTDNTVERYLERKSQIDLSSKVGQAKLAKFILGMANRDPAAAARHFEGYGVMVIGMTSEGELVGSNFPDPEQWEDGVRRFIGAEGPHWDINEVHHPDAEDPILLVLVDPPKPGDPMYLCHATSEGVADGHVYIRRPGKTVQADSAEMKMLMAREQASNLAVELEVSLDGEAVPVTIDHEASFEEYLAKKREELLAALPQPEPEPEPEPEEETSLAGLGGGLAGMGLASLGHNPMAEFAKSIMPSFEMPTAPRQETNWSALGLSEKPEPRSEQEYLDEIDAWIAEFRSKIPEAIDRMAAYFLAPVIVEIWNQSDAYLEDVAVKIHLEGAVRAVDWEELDREVPRRDYFDLPRPPRKWRPVKDSFLPPGLMEASHWQPGPIAFDSPTVSWRNSGSVDLEVKVDPLPPQKLHTDDSGELVLLLPHGHTEDVRGTWTATAKGHHKLYEGEFNIPGGKQVDVTEEFRTWLGLAG